MRHLLTISLILLGLVSTTLLFADEFWESKPYTSWSEKEARKLLTKSPWCYEYSWANHGDIGTYVSQGGNSEREYTIIFRVGLFSAHIMRQAFVAVVAKGDEQKFQKYHEFTERDYPDEIVISLNMDSKPKGIESVYEVHNQLLQLRLPDLINLTYLATDTGKKVFIKDYIPPTPDGTGAKFIFPRQLPDGTPFLTGSEETIKFKTIRFLIKAPPLSEGIVSERDTPTNYAREISRIKDEFAELDATFKVNQLVVNGKLDY